MEARRFEMLDKDIMRCKADILRAAGGGKTSKKSKDGKDQDATEPQQQPAVSNIKEIPVDVKKVPEVVPLRSVLPVEKTLPTEEAIRADSVTDKAVEEITIRQDEKKVDNAEDIDEPALETGKVSEINEVSVVQLDKAPVNVSVIKAEADEKADTDGEVDAVEAETVVSDANDQAGSIADQAVEIEVVDEMEEAINVDEIPETEEICETEEAIEEVPVSSEIDVDEAETEATGKSSMDELAAMVTEAESEIEPIEDAIEPELEAEPESSEPEESNGFIPEFNLADQILCEQRKKVAGRRKKTNGGNGGNNNQIAQATGTVGAIISKSRKAPAGDNGAEKESFVNPRNLTWAVHHVINGADDMSREQQGIIIDIVTRDIMELCRSGQGSDSAWGKYTNN